RVLHGEMDEHDFTIIDWHKANATATPTRDGTITWFMPESPNDSRIRVDYREGQPASQARQGQKEGETPPERPCAGELPYIAVCASVDLDPLVRPSFRDLEEGFFDDVLIADMEGSVLYQESRQGIRIQNIGAALLLSNPAASSSFFSRAQPSSPSVSTAPRPFATLSQSSARTTIELAGSDYELFVEPLRISLTQQQQHRRLVLCGLRTSKHSHAQTLVVPYAYLAWSILILGAVFALGWPLLKFTYMSAKERLQTRHILYLLASILLATALVTLIALNALYVQAFDKDSRTELKHLAEQINANFTAELSSAISALDALAIDPTLVKEGNQANFLHEHRDLFDKNRLSYPYFRYFFVAGDDGWQRLKFTVNPDTTPWTNVKEESFFHPVQDGQLSEFKLTTVRQLRLDPLFSPNTGEFLVTLAAPWADKADSGHDNTKATHDKTKAMKVLATKFESLFNPVLPAGYGYAIVGPDAKVLFHSSSVRNMNEDFAKEARGNPALLAALAQGTTDYLPVRYLGTDKKL